MDPRSSIFDPDLDAGPARGRPEPLAPVEDCQRLLANPWLGVVFWIVAFALMRYSTRRHDLATFVWSMMFVLVGIVFLQFHCLDCGKTGSLLFARKHACPAVVARRQTSVDRRRRMPAVKIQLAAWFVILVAALVLGFVASTSRR